MIGLAGASGAGKTKSALELATGLAGPNGKIVFIDTEAKRALHYAPAPGEKANPAEGTYLFHHVDMLPPFPPQKFTEAVEHYGDADVIVFDSMSHEFEGEGSISDMAQINQDGIPKEGVENPRDKYSRDQDWWKDWAQKPVDGPGAWKEPKRLHKIMMNSFLQARCHLIFCLRAHDKIRMEKQGGKTVVIQEGWSPVCEKSFMFEMTVSFTLRPDNPGKPDYRLPHKVQDQHLFIFPEGRFISVAAGEALRAWAAGDSQGKPAPAPKTKTPIDTYAVELGEKIKGDKDEFAKWWTNTADHRKLLKIPADRLGKMESAAYKVAPELKPTEKETE